MNTAESNMENSVEKREKVRGGGGEKRGIYKNKKLNRMAVVNRMT